MTNIKLYKDTREIPLKFHKFSAGEVYVAIDDYYENISNSCTIQVNLSSSDAIMQLLMLTSAIKIKWGDINIKLVMPYVPYARHDRVMNDGEALSIKVFCELINSQGYSEVIIYDPHSDVTIALISNVVVIPQEYFVQDIPITGEGCTLVAPDTGATKKAYKVAAECGFDEVLQAGKLRNTSTGEITDTVIYSEPYQTEYDFLIVDDICDGGRTFIELAKKLKEISSGAIYLYITHGIFSKGYSELKKYIDHIYVANNLGLTVTDKEYVTVVQQDKLERIIK